MTARITNLKFKLVSGGHHAKRIMNYEEQKTKTNAFRFIAEEKDEDGNFIQEEVLSKISDDKFEMRIRMPRPLFMRLIKEASIPGNWVRLLYERTGRAGRGRKVGCHLPPEDVCIVQAVGLWCRGRRD